MGGITINPGVQTNFPGTFSVKSDGYIQGLFEDDPAVRYALSGGTLATTETLPMWGGIGISETIPNDATQDVSLGGIIARATAAGNLTGFSVFNQNASAIITPQSNVPLVTNGMNVNFFRMGSGARIAVKCDPTLAASLVGGDLINVAVEWDYTNELLIPHGAGTAIPVKVLNVQNGNSKTVTFNGGTGFANWVPNGICALIQI